MIGETQALIKQRLTDALQPDALTVIDDSDAHIGHAGAEGGAGHFHIIISAADLNDKSRIHQHRMIYEAIGDLIPSRVHALGIEIK